jgi:hypothetical protein
MLWAISIKLITKGSIKEWVIILPISTLWIWSISSLPNLSVDSPNNFIKIGLIGLIILTIIIGFVNMLFGYVGISGKLDDIEKIELEILIKYFQKINICIIILLFTWLIFILLSIKYIIFSTVILLLPSISIGPIITLIILLLFNRCLKLENLRE